MAINVYDLYLRKNNKPYLHKIQEIKTECFPTGAKCIYKFVAQNTDLLKMAEENVLLLALDTRKVLSVFWVSKGTVDRTYLTSREIFIRLLLVGASRFVVVHNHPSGSLDFSTADKKTAVELRAAGELIGVPMLDFIAVTSRGYNSIGEQN